MGISYWQKCKGMGSNIWREFLDGALLLSTGLEKSLVKSGPPKKKNYYIYLWTNSSSKAIRV